MAMTALVATTVAQVNGYDCTDCYYSGSGQWIRQHWLLLQWLRWAMTVLAASTVAQVNGTNYFIGSTLAATTMAY